MVLREGFFYCGKGSQLPKPVARDKPWKGKKEFLRKLLVIERHAITKHFKGKSRCRICKCDNGSVEFQYGEWHWPNGLLHYVSEHNYKPCLPFLEFVLQRLLE